MSHHYVDDDPCWCQTHNDGMHDTLDCPVWQKESAEADLKEKGHGESCFYCNKKCNVVAGSPSDWPMRLPVDPKKPGVVQVVCTGCILERVFGFEKIKNAVTKYRDGKLTHTEMGSIAIVVSNVKGNWIDLGNGTIK